MSPSQDPPPLAGQLSRQGVGRLSGAMSHLFGGTSKVQAAGRFLRRQLWSWPVIAAVLFGGAGWWAHTSVESAMRTQRANVLNATVDTCVTAVRAWAGEQRIDAELIADDARLPILVEELLRIPRDAPSTDRDLVLAPSQERLRTVLDSKLKVADYAGFLVVAPDGTVVAADQDSAVGSALDGYRRKVFERAISGESVISKPFRSTLLLTDEQGHLRPHLPAMYAASPIRDVSGKVIAAIGLRIRPEVQFTKILAAAQIGQSGETFAFDRDGLLLSQSRFDESMKQVGLLVDQPGIHSILTVEVRDPGVDMMAGERPVLRRPDQPLTRMAAEAVQGHDGHDADGYRGYRGVFKVGAWRWLEDLDFAIGSDVDLAEALSPVILLRRAFRTLMALLALGAVGLFIAMYYMERQQRALRQATVLARQLGQYELIEKLGEGGMGTVYKARHAMLRRPTAVKLLDVEKMSDSAVARFEREVQLTSGLTHPNTVSVFDYGRTPDGVFYYAMEYLDGMNLDELVKLAGALPDVRAVHILRQVCGSLAEAHAAGLVHRDVKPANIFLTNRGGLYDYVKVLDFGLVKANDREEQVQVTQVNTVLGTPLYLSPEAVLNPDSVDARADVYAVGAVAYFLLTATPVFSGSKAMEVCWKQAHEPPEPPSNRCALAIDAKLESLVMRCLAKSPAERPRDAGDLLRELDALPAAGSWSRADAEQWWSQRGGPPGAGASFSTFTATRILSCGETAN